MLHMVRINMGSTWAVWNSSNSLLINDCRCSYGCPLWMNALFWGEREREGEGGGGKVGGREGEGEREGEGGRRETLKYNTTFKELTLKNRGNPFP